VKKFVHHPFIDRFTRLPLVPFQVEAVQVLGPAEARPNHRLREERSFSLHPETYQIGTAVPK
jgi:hypothetical protein